MEWTELLENLKIGTVFQLNWIDILIRLLLATFLGFYITFISYIFYTGIAFRQSVAHAQILLTIICAMIINVIGQNIAWAIGLIGALSFIRFRTNLRDPKDTAIFFYSVGTGIACGAGVWKVALGGVLILSLVLFVFYKFPFFRIHSYLIRFKTNSTNEVQDYMNYFTSKNWDFQILESSTKKETVAFLVFWDKKYKEIYIKDLYKNFEKKVEEISPYET
jgi:uncharacterized membrane protein YhiD involved in acid resistance